MILTRGEIGNLISALDLAIELTEMNQRSLLPPRAKDYDENDKESAAEWKENLKAFRKIRRKLQKVEDDSGPELPSSRVARSRGAK